MEPQPRRSILVVDDDPAIRRWLSRSLEGLEYQVFLAADLDAAEAILAGTHVDALILDLNLGGQSGLDLLQRIRGRDALARLPVVVLTGTTRLPKAVQEAITDCGAFIFYKPASIGDINKTLSREIDAS